MQGMPLLFVLQRGPERTAPGRVVAVEARGLSYDEKMALMALQGIVNRRGPILFAVGLHDFNERADRGWLRWFEGRYGARVEVATFPEVLRRLGGELRGLVVYDPEVPSTRLVALMLSSLEGLLPCGPELAKRLRTLGLKVRQDLRGRWRDHISPQRWAFEALRGRMARDMVGCIPSRSSWMLNIVDLLVMNRAFMCDLDQRDPEQRALKERIFSTIEPGGIVWGWTCGEGESEYVAMASRFGLRVLCSTNSPNMSFFSRLAPLLRERHQRRPRRGAKKVERKVYLTFVLSDGDSIPILLTRQWYRWDDPARGRVPFGWEVQPLLFEIAPAVLDFYYETATELDRFVVGPSGAGYVHPSGLPNLDEFVSETARLMRALDLRCGTVIDSDFPERGGRALCEGVAEAVGFFWGWGACPRLPIRTLSGKPYLAYWLCPPRPKGRKDVAYYRAVAEEIERIARREGLPCFVAAHLSCYWAGPSDVGRICGALGLPHEVLDPEEFLELLGRHLRGRVAPVLPGEVLLCAGCRNVVEVRLVNHSSEPREFEVRAFGPGGLSGGPRRARVEPEGEASVRMALQVPENLSEGVLKVVVAFDGSEERREAPFSVIPRPEGLDGRSVECLGIFEAERMGHKLGSKTSDEGALGGAAWVAAPGRDEPGDHLIYGPYQSLPEGNYVAAFRLKVDRIVGAPVAELDVFNFYAPPGRQVAARIIVKGSDFRKPGRYRWFLLPFRWEGEGKAEYRVKWLGRAALFADCVAVFRSR